jgi:hypothetical protein
LDSWDNRGTFGDSFGAINSLFSGLAFAGVIFTILLQRRELSLQREELNLTRKELHRTAEAQELSHQALAQQVCNQIIASKLDSLNSLIQITTRQIDELSDSSNPRVFERRQQLSTVRRHYESLLKETFSKLEDDSAETKE